ncbi:MAG: PilZ domain-containing protein [Calditrichaceae bacterium]|jgi:hypothetical protein
MKNSRNIKRRHLFFYLQVTDAKSGKLLGYVVDITPRGLKIISEERCDDQSAMNLKMKLPDDIGQKKDIYFDAKCIWSGKDVNSDFFANGFEILNLDESALHTIENIINEYGFEDLE